MSDEDLDQQISKHSSGVSIVIRIDGLWKDANNHSRAGLFSKWNNDLDAVWRELARDIKENKYEDEQAKFDEFDNQLIETGSFKDTGNETFDELSPNEIKKRSEQYKILNRKELFLKRMENTLGKGTTFAIGDEDDFE